MSETSFAAFAPSRQPAHALAAPGVRRLSLADFRSYPSLDLRVDDAKLVVLTGENGAGKTNLLESLSLLAPGRGLRRAELSECARVGGSGGFAVSAEIQTPNGLVQLGTGIEPQPDAPPVRRFRVNREPASSIRAFSDHVRVVWLTPAMDGLFTGPPGEPNGAPGRGSRCIARIDSDRPRRLTAPVEGIPRAVEFALVDQALRLLGDRCEGWRPAPQLFDFCAQL